MGPATFPERFSNLPPYAFSRLRAFLSGIEPGGSVVDMTIGSPMHDFPDWVSDVIVAHSAEFRGYPPNDGTSELRGAISSWIARRYDLPPFDPETRILPVNGSREGLFNSALALCPETKNGKQPVILMPNPFYQVYGVAALAVGATPVYVPATAQTGFLPRYDALPDDILNRTVAAYICSPSNPQGAVASPEYWSDLLALAEKYDFRVFSDECYSEIYRDRPPPGILQSATTADPERVLVFNSLSKRSNLAGLRSGFVASGPENVTRMKTLRGYSGAPLTLPLQRVSEKIWADEAHVEANRALYRAKFDLAETLFADVDDVSCPEAGFFLWLPVANGEDVARRLWAEAGVRVLPGAFLGRVSDGNNPGEGYIRVALVAPMAQLRPGLAALKRCLYQ